MKVGILGLPQAGKKTLLRLLTGVDATTMAPSASGIPAVCPVRDPRMDKLVGMYKPKKTTPARMELLLLPDLTKDSAKNQELFKALLLMDVLALVVRAFADESVFHIEGSVDALRDVEFAQAEFLLNDLLFIEKRLQRLTKDKRADSGPEKEKEQALLQRMQAHLNESRPLRTFTFSPEERKLLSSAPLLTRKPVVVVVNAGEDGVSTSTLAEQVKAKWPSDALKVVQVSAKIEEELAQLEDAAERTAFLSSLGLSESAIDRLSRVVYEALGLISYFTVGVDEVRAWTVRRGAMAPEAGGAIHSDIERGFIRAEQMRYDDLIALGTEQAVAAAGKASLKGKDYVVADGDILNFRFNV